MFQLTDILAILLLSIVLYFVYKFITKSIEGLDSKPRNTELSSMIDQVMTNIELFKPNTYNTVVQNIPWMDVTIFEDVRLLQLNNSVNRENIKKILNGK